MNSKDLINYVLSLLDKSILDDEYFKLLKSMLNIETGQITHFFLNQELYDNIQNELVKSKIIISEDKSNICSFCLKNGEDYFTFVIEEIKGILVIEAKKETFFKILKTTYYNDKKNFMRIENIEIKKSGHKYLDYHCNIKSYLNGSLIDTPKIDYDHTFANFFNVPIEDARKYRTNFKKYASLISGDVLSSKMEVFDGFLTEKDFCLFTSPFLLSDFSGFINRETNKDYQEFLRKEFGTCNDTFDDICHHEFDFIINNLINQVGNGQVIISKNIYSNLQTALFEEYFEKINTQGIMIKKEECTYMFYWIVLKNNEIIVMPKKLSSQELEDLYYLNEANELVPDLKEFLGIQRIL